MLITPQVWELPLVLKAPFLWHLSLCWASEIPGWMDCPPSSGCSSVCVQLRGRVLLFTTPWTAACQASLSFTISQSLLILKSIESVMSSNNLIISYPLLLLPSIFLSIRIFSSESFLHIRWPKYWSFSFSISPSNDYPGSISFRIDWFDFLAEPW